jgi:signal recognition particle receptor subunit beta
MQTNSSTLTLDGRKPMTVIDVPGHPRIRDQFKDHMPNARAVLFVVDASTISRNGAAVAECALSLPSSLAL